PPQPTPTTTPQPPPPPPQQQQEEDEPDPPPQSSGTYTCSTNKYNCTDFKTHAEAQAVFDQCGGADNDVHKLDNNKDGEACESLP
ncbi:MAG: excalibur calcium-binding domain-containing protein, partial [Minisyncoccia bacterium]